MSHTGWEFLTIEIEKGAREVPYWLAPATETKAGILPSNLIMTRVFFKDKPFTVGIRSIMWNFGCRQNAPMQESFSYLAQ